MAQKTSTPIELNIPTQGVAAVDDLPDERGVPRVD